MSILIQIPKHINYNPEHKNQSEDSVEEKLENNSINLPKQIRAKSNDLSKLEASMTSSKYTLSGDEMASDDLSFNSDNLNGKISFNQIIHNEQENEIDIENKKVNNSTPKKLNQIQQRNFYHNNETNNNFSSERVICEELSKGQVGIKEKNNMSNLSDLINEKHVQINYQHISPDKEENNFIYKYITGRDLNNEINKKPKILNNGFIMEDKINNIYENNQRINKINEKVNSMIKTQDTISKNSDSAHSSHSSSVKLTCFQKICSSNKKNY